MGLKMRGTVLAVAAASILLGLACLAAISGGTRGGQGFGSGQSDSLLSFGGAQGRLSKGVGLFSKSERGSRGNGVKLKLQAVRRMILKAKKALDEKATVELDSLEGRGKARVQQLVQVAQPHESTEILKPEVKKADTVVEVRSSNKPAGPSSETGTGTALQSQGKGTKGKAAKVVKTPVQTAEPVTVKRMNANADEANPRQHGKLHKLAGGDVQMKGEEADSTQDERHNLDPMSKAELSNFVKTTIEQEKKVLAETSGATSSHPSKDSQKQQENQLAYHHRYYDNHGYQSWWCQDNSNWRGPFGDPCVSYAVGGDRQFWCEWDGANAQHACPRSCGTCSHHALKESGEKREAENHILKAHFDPQVGHKIPGATNDAKAEETASKVAKSKVKSKETGEGPHEPKSVARNRSINGKLLKEVEGMKKRLEMVAEATQDVARQLKLSHKDNKEFSSAEAQDDLQSFFKGEESDSKAKHAHYVRKSLGKKHTSGWAISDLMSWFDSKGKRLHQDTHKQVESRAAVEDHPILSPKKRKMSAVEAAKDIQSYWSSAEKKLQAPSGKGGKPANSRLPQYTSADANHDLADFLDKMVKGAEKAHAAETKLIKQRQQKKGASEAVSGKMTDKEAADALDTFWKKMPDEAVPTSKFGVQTPPEPKAMKQKFESAKEVTKNEKKSASATPAAKEKTNAELGLPANGQEAVHVVRRKMTSKHAHDSLDSYFSNLLNHAKSEDHYDQKTREILAARARKLAIARAKARVAKRREQQIAALKQEARQQQLYLQEPTMGQMSQGLATGNMPGLNQLPTLSPQQVQFNNAYNSFLASVDSQASNPNYKVPVAPKLQSWQSPTTAWQAQASPSFIAEPVLAVATSPQAMQLGTDNPSMPGVQNQAISPQEGEAQKALENIANSNGL